MTAEDWRTQIMEVKQGPRGAEGRVSLHDRPIDTRPHTQRPVDTAPNRTKKAKSSLCTTQFHFRTELRSNIKLWPAWKLKTNRTTSQSERKELKKIQQ